MSVCSPILSQVTKPMRHSEIATERQYTFAKDYCAGDMKRHTTDYLNIGKYFYFVPYFLDILLMLILLQFG